MTQQLKTDARFFELIKSGKKKAEIRYCGDRTFSRGGYIELIEVDDLTKKPTGRELRVVVTHVLTHEDFPQGLQPDHACISFYVSNPGDKPTNKK